MIIAKHLTWTAWHLQSLQDKKIYDLLHNTCNLEQYDKATQCSLPISADEKRVDIRTIKASSILFS